MLTRADRLTLLAAAALASSWHTAETAKKVAFEVEEGINQEVEAAMEAVKQGLGSESRNGD
jgi:hypothetical protein